MARLCYNKGVMLDNLEKQKLELEIAETEYRTKNFFESYPKIQKYFLVILIAMTIPIYFIAKYAVGALYFQDFQKTSIQVHSATLTSFPVAINEVKILPLTTGQGSGNYSAYALITNPNKSLVAPELDYTFRFFDFTGKEIKPSVLATGKEFLLAGEKKYIILPNVSLSTPPYNVKLDLVNPAWKKRLDLPSVTLQADQPSFGNQQDPLGFTVDGNISNQSSFTLGTVKVNAVVYDRNGAVIAVTQSTINSLGPKARRAYHLYWPVQFGSSANSVQVLPETDILDLNNIK